MTSSFVYTLRIKRTIVSANVGLDAFHAKLIAMSNITAGIPSTIEQQLLAIDKQLRDAAFVRGMSRTVLVACLSIGSCLLADGLLDLNTTARECLLAVAGLLICLTLWRGLIRRLAQPISLSAVAALVEKQFPELRERLTSLVELRDSEATDLAPGASRLMQELLTRQTVTALERVSLEDVDSKHGAGRLFLAGFFSLVLLLLPFGLAPEAYGLLWQRFCLPWNNVGWGALISIEVLEGDRIVARGTDVPVYVTVARRFPFARSIPVSKLSVGLKWSDDRGASDQRRMDWDETLQQFTTTLPHVASSFSFHATADGGKSKSCHVDVSDPPSLVQLSVDIEPDAYTGLPARHITGVAEALRIPEYSRVRFQAEFRDAVTSAELKWPEHDAAQDSKDAATSNSLTPPARLMALSRDQLSADLTVAASESGPFEIDLKNRHGLASRCLTQQVLVDRDQPPAFHLDDAEDVQFCQRDEPVELAVDVSDDYGLTAVELVLDRRKGDPAKLSVPAEELRGRDVAYTFSLDFKTLDLDHVQVVTYRFRAVDNRPKPAPHEVWTPYRSLVIRDSSHKQIDPQLLAEQQRLEESLTQIRTVLNQMKSDAAKLQRKMETAAAGKSVEPDKSMDLKPLQESQQDLNRQMDQFAEQLVQRPLTRDLSESIQNVTRGDLDRAIESIEQAGTKPVRDQIEPLANAVDHFGAADRQLKKLEQQLSDLHKLEQDLGDLKRLASRAERIANQLDQFGKGIADADSAQKIAADEQHIQEKLADVLKKHPELIDAARRNQQEQLRQMAEQAKQIAEPQSQLAKAIKQSAETNGLQNTDKPPSESQPEDSRKDQIAGENVAAEQARLEQAAVTQARQLADQTGTDSEATKAAAEFARQAHEAKRRALVGELADAANAAKKAAAAASQVASELNPDGNAEIEPARQAGTLAEQQNQVAENLDRLAANSPARRGAQQEGQRQLATAAKQLAQTVDRLSRSMKSDAANSPEDAKNAETARDSLKAAEQLMKQSAQSNAQNDSRKAADQAQAATEKLEQAASVARQPAQKSSAANPVPAAVGASMAQLKQDFHEAQQSLADCPCQNPGTGNGKSTAANAAGSQSNGNSPAKSDEIAAAEKGPADSSGAPVASPDAQGQPPTPSAANGESPPSSGEGEKYARAANQFRTFAAMLKQSMSNQIADDAMTQQKSAQKSSASTTATGNGHLDQPKDADNQTGASANGVNATAQIEPFESQQQMLPQSNWGRLPGKLRTEILQGAGKKSHPEYTQRIKAYFEEITRPQ